MLELDYLIFYFFESDIFIKILHTFLFHDLMENFKLICEKGRAPILVLDIKVCKWRVDSRTKKFIDFMIELV